MGREPEPFALTAEEAVAAMSAAVAEPLPDGEFARWEPDDDREFGGEGFRGLRLAMSGFFWDSTDHVDAEYERMEALQAAVLERWAAIHGRPSELQLFEWDEWGIAMGHPLGEKCFGAKYVLVWRLEQHVRFVALGVNHEDKELPVELLAVVGGLPWLDAARPWRREEAPGPSLGSVEDIARLNAAPRPAPAAPAE